MLKLLNPCCICLGLTVLLLGTPAFALDPNALPTGGNVIEGAGNIGAAGNQMGVIPNENLIIPNWNIFPELNTGVIYVSSELLATLPVPVLLGQPALVEVIAMFRNDDDGMHFVVGPQGGGMKVQHNIDNQAIPVSTPVSGTGRFTLSGTGVYTFSSANTQTGGTGVTDGATVVVSNDNQLGIAFSQIYLDYGKIRLTNEYASSTSNQFSRSIAIGSRGGVIEAPNGEIIFLGKEITGSGRLDVSGLNFHMADDLRLDATLVGDLSVPTGLVLKGSGAVEGNLTVFGALSPGNSPGTFFVNGSVVQNSGSILNIEIDGLGTGNGAGNYDRLILTGAGSTYTAGGTLATQLRGISGSANNDYSPPLGQGFQIVSAPGGILGNFSAFTQPTSGLLPGTQLDTVFGSTSLNLYATPSSYSNIAAAGVATNSNRQQIGDILQPIRPTPGVRESNATRKLLFDSLAPQTTSSLPVAMDQLAGVGYGQLIGMNFENSKFFADQMALTVAQQRRGEGGYLIAGEPGQTLGEAQEELWGTAVGRLSNWQGDNVGYNTYDVLGGVMGGIQKRFTPQSLAGFSLAYGGSSPTISQNMGSAPMQNLQLMAYGSQLIDGGFYTQALLGGGGGTLNASRNLSMMNASYTAQIQTANLAGSAFAGWGNASSAQIRYETGMGLNYLGMRQFAFNDSGSQSAYALTTQAGNTQSLVPNLSATMSLPFQVAKIDWRAHGLVNVGYETADNKITLQSNFMGNRISVDSASIGRTRLNLGLGLSGYVGKETRVALDLSNQSAQNWNATAANVSVRVGF